MYTTYFFFFLFFTNYLHYFENINVLLHDNEMLVIENHLYINTIYAAAAAATLFVICALVTFVLHLHFITLCLVRRSSSERRAVTLGWRLSLLVWCWRSELLCQLGPAGGDREPDCCRNLKTEQGLSNTRAGCC